jgi:hypothetical protein
MAAAATGRTAAVLSLPALLPVLQALAHGCGCGVGVVAAALLLLPLPREDAPRPLLS